MDEQKGSNQCCHYKLSLCGIGFSAAIVWGLGILLLGIVSTYIDWGRPMVELVASIYVGYDSTIAGSFIGGFWGFIDALIGGIIFAFLYNILVRRCPCPGCRAIRSAKI